MDGLPLLQILAPHLDTPLVVAHNPALLAQTLRLEAGKCAVVRDGHSLSRHGLLPRRRERHTERENGGVFGTLVGPEEKTMSRGGNEAATLVLLLCVDNLSNSICSLQEAFVGCAVSCDGRCACERARVQGGTTAAILPQTNQTQWRETRR